MPAVVAHKISLPTRRRYWKANCCAMAPPHETPITSTSSMPCKSSSLRVQRASIQGRYGQLVTGLRPTPGTSKVMISLSGNISPRPSVSSRFAPMPLKNSKGRCPELPGAIHRAVRNWMPSTSWVAIVGRRLGDVMMTPVSYAP